MNVIGIILNHFGFPIRELADVLDHSPSQILNVERNRRNASAQLTNILSHPLFAEVDTTYIPEPENDAGEEEWLRVQLLEAEARVFTEKSKLKVLSRKRKDAQNIARHTAQLDMDAKKGVDLVADWWRWQRSRALFKLQMRKPIKDWAQERRVYLAEQEVIWLRKKLLNW